MKKIAAKYKKAKTKIASRYSPGWAFIMHTDIDEDDKIKITQLVQMMKHKVIGIDDALMNYNTSQICFAFNKNNLSPKEFLNSHYNFWSKARMIQKTNY